MATVYIALGVSSGIVKIGYTTNLKRRLNTLNGTWGDRYELAVAVPGTKIDEKQAHIFCGTPVLGREWFLPSRKTTRLITFWKKNRRPSSSPWKLV